MLNNQGFDLWADGYDASVGLSDEEQSYPFAGYKQVLNHIYGGVLADSAKNVLDIGFGTGTLTAKLYEQGCTIWGQDFSGRMIELAREKMPEAHLYQGDFSQGLVPALLGRQYDAIVATYSLHHLSDEEKPGFLKALLPLLQEGGCLYIGDVAFETRKDLAACREQCGDQWDEEEFYFIYEEIRQHFPGTRFTRYSHCAGVLEIRR